MSSLTEQVLGPHPVFLKHLIDYCVWALSNPYEWYWQRLNIIEEELFDLFAKIEPVWP